MSNSGPDKKVANSLLALSSAAVLAVYTAGYLRTKPAADRFAEPEWVSERHELSDRLAEELRELPPRYRAPVILRHFLEADRPPDRAICMVQREVALRMAAKPPDLLILGVAMQVYAEVSVLFDVPPDAFVPRPKVFSSVVLLQRHRVPVIEPSEREAFFRLVTAGFAQKRKTVLNSLAAALPAANGVCRVQSQSASPL